MTTTRMTTRIASIAAFVAAFAFAAAARAQEPQADLAQPEGAAAQPAAKPASEAADASAQDRISALEQRLEEQKAEFEERLRAVEETQENQALEALPTGFEPSFGVYGYFDLTFNKFFPKEDGFFEGTIHDSASFFVQNLNLYFNSQMTETLSAISELRFSFAPTGQERSIEVEGFSDYERAETEVSDPFSGEEYRLGGIKIERVHLTWTPSEYFGVIAGRFLTPYGIWNIEHGTPVLISVRHPVMQISHYLPSAQTGVQLFGAFHPKPGHQIQYGITLTNGRGPMDEVYDLDDNKAAGLRLRYVYDTPKARLTLGGYGYTGDYTDQNHRITTIQPFDMDYYVTEQYREWIGSLDALLEVKGFRLQGEYVRRLVKYKERPLREPEDGGGYPADFAAHGTYVLVAYTLPLEKLLGQMTITPYFMAEHNKLNDTDDRYGCDLVAGLNFRPSPYVVLKAEYYYVIFPEWHKESVDAGLAEEAEEYFWGIAAQMAVSF